MKQKLILSLILGIFMFGMVSAIQGNSPTIQIISVNYTNQAGNPISMAYNAWDNILITAIVSDSDGWSDVKNPDLVFGDNNLNCNRVEIISTTAAKYECSLTILPAFSGAYELHFYAIDKGGLVVDNLIGSYYFNPTTTLTHDTIVFNGNEIAGQTVTTDWINVNVDTSVNNPIEVALYGKNLYESLSNCADVNICTRYENVCHNEIVKYLDKTKGECNKVPYQKEYTKKTCSTINRKTVCTTSVYTKTLYKTVCETIHYQQPVFMKVCANTDNCLNWKTVKQCDSTIVLHRCGLSNVMELSYFEYLVEGTSNWKQVQISSHKETIFQGNGDSNFRIMFRVNIPTPCSGDYILDGSNLFMEVK